MAEKPTYEEMKQRVNTLEKELTERKLAEKSLLESETLLKAIMDNAPVLISAKDLKGNVIMTNRRFEVLDGPTPEEFIGKNIYDLFPFEIADALWKNDLAAIEANVPVESEEIVAHKDKAMHFYHTVKFPLSGVEDKAFGTCAISVDITERLKAEEALQKAHDELEKRVEERTTELKASNEELYQEIKERKREEEERRQMEARLRQAQKMEAIGTLAGGIAHQFNNALSIITGNIDLLEMDFPGDENVANYAGELKASARRMTKLTAQLLAYGRGGKYQAKTVSLNDFVRDALPLVKQSIDSDINVETDLHLDTFNVKADRVQMQMVLSAVFINASEAMEGKGCIRVACSNEIITEQIAKDFYGFKPGTYAGVTITDNGVGMDEEAVKRVFDPFYTTKFAGRGLGMAAAYGFVKNHDGYITVDSELGKGTTVKIYLPAVETPVKEDITPKTEGIKGTGTILVIDDDESVMSISRAMLERQGYRALEAKTGREAIDVAKTFDGDIDLAILDIMMPDMNGNAVYPYLVKARPNLKVIVSSGYSKDGPAQEILNSGAEDFIQKPFTMAELSEKLKKTLGSE
jgi:PAS domain S-box-containing protein